MSHVLRSVDLSLVRLPLLRPFTTSSHTKDHLDHIILRVRDDEGAEGWGECASPSRKASRTTPLASGSLTWRRAVPLETML